jgi:hypothetical protein
MASNSVGEHHIGLHGVLLSFTMARKVDAFSPRMNRHVPFYIQDSDLPNLTTIVGTEEFIQGFLRGFTCFEPLRTPDTK